MRLGSRMPFTFARSATDTRCCFAMVPSVSPGLMVYVAAAEKSAKTTSARNVRTMEPPAARRLVTVTHRMSQLDSASFVSVFGAAVVGLGIGTEHVRAMRRQPERFQVRAVCDPDDARSGAVAERIEADVQSLDDILRRDDIDVVALCTPPFLHRRQIEQVLRAGTHCVCE